MPDDPQPDPNPEPVLDARGVPIPSEQELAAVAEPATVRHAPKYGAFITAGALVGVVVALVLVAIIRPAAPWVSDGSGFISFLDGEGAVRTVMAVAGAVLGGFVGGALAVLADRRSVRRAVRTDV
ncbi:histidine kinase [Cellulomonas humilata]|uniref:histidine kinase n=1 Tax=Cellulomonas humilata TaxID=144055 RepID=UPI001B356A2E|nr:histidine kinase [Cellulomonas humilata]